MCGFAGVIGVNIDEAGLEALASGMALRIKHRGPDDAGVWVDQNSGVALGHRRLAIVDLSPAGHQPMMSATGRFVIAFNGEIYNHNDMRTSLESVGVSPAWRGRSDTETLLASFEHWGVQTTLERAVGMFAFALWDVNERTLHLARDRFGEKPLYYGWAGSGDAGSFVFGSELKALRAFPGFVNPVSREALVQYMRFTVVPAPRSIYTGIFKLESGCILSIRDAPPAQAPTQPLRPGSNFGSILLRRWWSLADVVVAGAHAPFADETEALLALEERLRESVRLQSLADVPLGAFLSGGVDSSAIVALMQQQATRAVKTFTVGFEESSFDESPYARAVAQHIGTDHTELFVTATEVQAVIPDLPTIYDEPFADSSQIPTYLVCRAARQHVTVALSGDSGDELFGGYNRYFWGPRIWSWLAWLPFRARQMLGSVLGAIPVGGWDALAAPLNAMLAGENGIAHWGDMTHKLASRLRSVRNLDDLYLSLVSEWQDPAAVVRGSDGPVSEPLNLLADALPAEGVEQGPLRMMYQDSITYLPDDILCKVDRAAMAISLETRVPFLDHRVAELAWRLPSNMKLRGNAGKWALRQVLYKHVPRKLIERPKAGFAIPLGDWLRGPLRDWAERLLDEQLLLTQGYFYPGPIRNLWAEHKSGRRDHTASLWTVLMFQSWLQEHVHGVPACSLTG